MTDEDLDIIARAAEIVSRDNRYYLPPRKRYFLLGLALGLLIGALALSFCD